MADTSIATAVHNATDARETSWGPFYCTTQKGVQIYGDNGSDITKAVTSDGGASWTITEILAGTTKRMACWPDWATPGDTGTLVHIAWLDTDNNLRYMTVDADGGTEGTIRVVDSTITVSATDNLNRIAITKAKNGNIVIAGSTQTELICYKSSDGFASAGSPIADVFETATQEDHCLLFPANTADDADVAALFWDRSANEITCKVYDDSANSWAEGSAIGSMVDDNISHQFSGAVRHSDGHIIMVAHSDADSAGDDLLCYDINPAATITVTAKTNIFTNQAESASATVTINQQNDDIYVAYCKGGTWQTSVDVVFHKSTDGGTTWDSESAYSEGTADDFRIPMSTMSITDAGGRWQPSFYNDDTTDIWVNLVNDVEVAAASADTFVPKVLCY